MSTATVSTTCWSEHRSTTRVLETRAQSVSSSTCAMWVRLPRRRRGSAAWFLRSLCYDVCGCVGMHVSKVERKFLTRMTLETEHSRNLLILGSKAQPTKKSLYNYPSLASSVMSSRETLLCKSAWICISAECTFLLVLVTYQLTCFSVGLTFMRRPCHQLTVSFDRRLTVCLF